MVRNTKLLPIPWEHDCKIQVSNFVDCIILTRKLGNVTNQREIEINVVFSSSVFRKDCSPGPGYFIEASITRSGKDGTPNYSILGRQKDPSKYSYFLFLSGHSPELVTVSVRCPIVKNPIVLL